MVSLELLQSFRDARRHDNQGPVASKSVPKRLLSEGGSDKIWLLQLRDATNLYFHQARRKRVPQTCAAFNDTVRDLEIQCDDGLMENLQDNPAGGAVSTLPFNHLAKEALLFAPLPISFFGWLILIAAATAVSIATCRF
jgi:hypothetical protein